MAASGFAANELRSLIHRVERMDEEIAAGVADRKEIFAEAKARGFDTKIMRMVIRVRKMDAADWQEQCALLDMYLSAMQISADVREAAHEALREAAPEPSPEAAH